MNPKGKISGFFYTNRFYLLILLASFLLYGNTIRNNYCLDDEFVVYGNPLVQEGLAGIPKILGSFYSDDGRFRYEYRPIVKVSYALEYSLFGENPHMSHFINILLYFLVCALLYRILKKLLHSYGSLLPLIITLLFMCHPVHTEVVASLKNRDELLSFLFSALALWYSLIFADRKKWYYPLPAVLFFILAYLSKSSAMVFAALIPVSLFFYNKISLKNIFIILALLVAGFIFARILPRFILPKPNRIVFFYENPLFYINDSLLYAGTMLKSLLFYLRILLIPHPLVCYYGYDMIPVEGPGNPWVIVSLIVHIALFVFAVIKLKKRHFLSYAILFYLIAISMYSNIRPAVGIVAERYAFTASLGFCMIIAWLIWRISLKGKETTGVPVVKTHRLLVLFALFVIPYSAKTISRNSDWYDHETLLSHDIQYMENSAKGNSIYADKLMNDITWNIEQTGNLQQNIPTIKRAGQLYRQSVKIYPQFAPSLNSLGFIRYAFYGQYDRALPYFRNAISADPEYFEAYFNLGLCYEKLMKTDSAIFFYNRAIEYDPAHMRGKKFLANLYLSMNDTSHAFILYRDITASDNTTQEPFVIMAQYYLATGDTIHAMKLMEEVYKRTPGDKNLAQGLAEWFRRAGNMEKAEFYDQCSRK